MPIYTFYPYTAEGSALMFEALDLADDEIAIARAGLLLNLHASAAEVVVWQDEREVHRETRAGLAAPAAWDTPQARAESPTTTVDPRES